MSSIADDSDLGARDIRAAQATCWHRPAWSGARLRPRALLLSTALHVLLVAGLAHAWSLAPPAAIPELALHRVLGAPPPPPREPPPTPDVRVEVEEPQVTVEFLAEPFAPEPLPIVHPEEPLPNVLDPVPPDRPRPDRTVIRRPPPTPRVEVPPEPPAPPPAPAGVTVAPVPLDDENEPPAYPPRAIALSQEGTVWLRVTVGEDGRVCGCGVLRSSGYPLLDRAALTAVCEWRFTGGVGEVDLPIDFVLRLRQAR